mmetsp:Transcript_90121/g.289095  ORF Transcript_90121/g.289095 Transcript_90121/m.289095 type:complete len:116 (-) Transcript_90121:68-415(-)
MPKIGPTSAAAPLRSVKKTNAKSSGDAAPRYNHYLLKSEPGEFSIDMLAAEPKATAVWDGVRNYGARNNLRNMKVGTKLFFYHSSCPAPGLGIVGTAVCTREAFPDPSATDGKGP